MFNGMIRYDSQAYMENIQKDGGPGSGKPPGYGGSGTRNASSKSKTKESVKSSAKASSKNLSSKQVAFDRLRDGAGTKNYFDEAFEKVKSTDDIINISSALSYGLNKNEMISLVQLHESGKHQDKIEKLLENINYSTEANDMHNGEYDAVMSSYN